MPAFLWASTFSYVPALPESHAPGFAENLKLRGSIASEVEIQARHAHCKMDHVTPKGLVPGPMIPYIHYALKTLTQRASDFHSSTGELADRLFKPPDETAGGEASKTLRMLIDNLALTKRLQKGLQVILQGLTEIEGAKDEDFESNVQYELVMDSFTDNYLSDTRAWSNRYTEALDTFNKAAAELAAHQEDIKALINSYRALFAE